MTGIRARLRHAGVAPMILAGCIATLLASALPAAASGEDASPPVAMRIEEVAPPLRAAWQEAGRPMVILVPDHLGLDERAAFHAAALRERGLAVAMLDLPRWPAVDRWTSLLPAAPPGPEAAAWILPPLVSALRQLAGAPSGTAKGGEGPARPLGILGFGPGAEAALLAMLPAETGPSGRVRIAALAALYPSCASPDLAAARRAWADRPILAILPHPGGAGDMPGGCAPLFDDPADGQGRVEVRAYDSLGYGFDLWAAAATGRGAAGWVAAGEGDPDPRRFDVLRAEMARRDVARFFAETLAASPPRPVASLRAEPVSSPPPRHFRH